MPKIRLASVGAAVLVTLSLSSCAVFSGGSNEPEAVKTAGGTVAYTVGDSEYSGYNGLLASTFSLSNGAVNDRMMSGFGFYLPDGKWHQGGDLGDYEKVSDSPLKVTYTVNPDAKYEGGTPITCEDFYLDWVSQNPRWILEAQAKDGKVDPVNGNPIGLFNRAGNPNGYAALVKKGPECEAGDKTFTVEYSQPNPDWQLLVGGPLPSHVVAKAIGMDKKTLFTALKNHDFEVAKKAAEFWNHWVAPKPGQLEPKAQRPSFGPYTIKDDGWKAGDSVTLVRNPDWWGTPGEADELVVKEIKPSDMVEALKSGKVNVIEPVATKKVMDQLKAAGDKVKVVVGASRTWEHLDFNFAPASLFNDSDQGLKLRQAFAYCVPRQKIVDEIVKPINPEAKVLNAREFLPGDSAYESTVKSAYDGAYDKVDIAKAKSLIAESGVQSPTVNLVYDGDETRSKTVELIKKSCEEAGFKIDATGDPDFQKKYLNEGKFDVALFAWSGSGQVTAGAGIYTSAGPQNYSRFSSPTVDTLWQKLQQQIDPEQQNDLKASIELELWKKLYNLPLYVHPEVVAYSSGLLNVQPSSTQYGVMWNAEKWGWEKKP